MKNKKILSLIMIVYLIASISSMNIKISNANNITEVNKLYSTKPQAPTYISKNEITLTTTNLVDSEPIVVIGNNDFDDTIWSGDGSQDHPWTLDSYRVSGYTVGVYIENVDVYFLIKNCHFVNNYFGAYFVDTTNGVIENNNISYNEEEGVVLMSMNSYSGENTLDNNHINHNRIGIQLGMGFPFQPWEDPSFVAYLVGPSNSNVITNNEIHSNYLSGLDNSYSSLNKIEFNSVNGTICISRESERNSIYHNSINGRISLSNCKSNTIKNNNLDSGSIHLYNSEKNDIYENTIKNSASPGMYLSDSHKNEIFSNTICGHHGGSGWDPLGSGNGIKLSTSHTNLIYNNDIYENRYAGIYFYGSSENNSIEGNTIYDNQIGILFNGTYTGNCIMNNNIYENTDSGILISKAFLFSKYQYICGNSIHENNIGIKLFYASENIIEYNRLYCNTLGLVLSDSSLNIIMSNVIQNNTQYGVSSGSSAQNNITVNNFLCNYMLCEYPNSGFRQAYDDGNLNHWNANFWDDRTSTGPYAIDGPGGSEDTSPAEDRYDLSELTCDCTYDIMTSETRLNFGILEIMLTVIIIIFLNTKIVRRSKNGLLNKKNRRLDNI